MERKRIFIVVKTYPTISAKYAELVCTAGVLEDGAWIRLYPLPFRKLEIEQKFKKYSWINIDVERNQGDFRPETYRVLNMDSIVVEETPKSKNTPWDYRKEIIFKNKKIYTSIQELITLAKTDLTSLAVFKPTEIMDFVIEKTDRDWPKEKVEILKAESMQYSLFQSPEQVANEYKLAKKVPYKFSYHFKDDTGTESTLMIEDWEIGMLYFHCLENAKGDEQTATEKVKEKYFKEYLTKDLYLFLGTTKQFHNIAPNPFIIIISVFPPPKDDQGNLFGDE
jgi:hypothetical protein